MEKKEGKILNEITVYCDKVENNILLPGSSFAKNDKNDKNFISLNRHQMIIIITMNQNYAQIPNQIK